MLLSHNDAVLSEDNNVDIYIDGNAKFEALIEDIRNAKDHIHLQYYIFRFDELGKKLIHILTKKAREGIEVCVLFDDLGSRKLRRRHFKELIEAGGVVEVFFPSPIPYVNLRLNYRNHRKIVVIDGQIGYVGGFNVGDEYLGKDPSFGYWRDTHLRVKGSAVHALQTRFILDWNQASKRHDFLYHERLFQYLQQKAMSHFKSSQAARILNGSQLKAVTLNSLQPLKSPFIFKPPISFQMQVF